MPDKIGVDDHDKLLRIVAKAIRKFEKSSGKKPSAILMHPDTWDALQQSVGAGPRSRFVMLDMFGVRMVPDVSVEKGEMLLVDEKLLAEIQIQQTLMHGHGLT